MLTGIKDFKIIYFQKKLYIPGHSACLSFCDCNIMIWKKYRCSCFLLWPSSGQGFPSSYEKFAAPSVVTNLWGVELALDGITKIPSKTSRNNKSADRECNNLALHKSCHLLKRYFYSNKSEHRNMLHRKCFKAY